MKKFLLSVTLLMGSLQAYDVSSSLKLRMEGAVSTEDADLQKAIGYGKWEVKVDVWDDVRIVGVARLMGDAKDKIEPQKFGTSSYSDISKPLVLGRAGYGELRELYFEKSFEDTLLKVGKMQSVWGKADGIKLLDVLNPQDFSEFILAPFEESRIPLWTLSLVHSFEESELEFLWIPDTSFHKFAKRDGVYAFTSPRLVPQAPAGISVALQEVQKPDDFFEDSDVGLRYTMNLSDLELGFYGLYSYGDAPVFFQDVDVSKRQVRVTPAYKRSTLLGMSMDYSLGDFVYRLELGYGRGKYFLNTRAKQGVLESDELSYVLGVDWYGLDESVLSMQLYQSYLLKDEGRFMRPKVDNTLTLLYKKDFYNNILHAEILAIHNINDGDGVLRPKLTYELDEESVVYAGLDYFYGDKEGLYGEFREQSRVLFGIERTF